MLKVKRYFLEIDPLIFNNKKIDLPVDIQITLDKKKDFNVNKFFYKQIGVDHYWRDRLIWSDKEWIKYISNVNFETWIIKKKDNLIGFYEQEFHPDLNEVELINM
jgi:hypothetical protein